MWVIFVGFLYIAACALIPIGLIVWLSKRRKRRQSEQKTTEAAIAAETPKVKQEPEIVYDRAEFEIADGILKKYLGNALEVHIPEGVKSIGSSAFCENQRIRKVYIPGSVKEIGAEAFKKCEMLSDVQFAEGLSVIEGSAFDGCVSLKKLDFPQSISVIGYGAFSNCSLNEIHFRGNDLSGIDGIVFDKMSIREVQMQVYVPTLSAWLKKSNDFFVTYSLYVDGSLLESVTMSANVPSEVFCGCKSLKSVKFESTVEEIGKEAFVGCPISSLYIPQNVVVIGDEAFSCCENLKEVKLPSAYRARINSIFKDCRDIKFEFYD